MDQMLWTNNKDADVEPQPTLSQPINKSRQLQGQHSMDLGLIGLLKEAFLQNPLWPL